MKDPFPSATLPNTAPLTWSGDLSGKMNAGLHEYLDRKTRESASFRDSLWKHGSPSSPDSEAFLAGERQRLANLIGLVEERFPPQLTSFRQVGAEPVLAETESYRIEAVRWPVFAEITGEGLLLSPKGPVQARLVAVPDANQTPEDLIGLTDRVPDCSQFPRHLAEVGCQVVVVCLLSRESTYSRSELIEQTNQPHREWIYRQAYPLGRHPIGLEVQKLLSLVDWFTEEEDRGKARIGMAGYGEGALLGRLDDPVPDPNPRSRKIYDTEHWCGYDVVLDLWEEACVWGILCVPKDLSPGERRPAVVCQHGWEGTPTDTIENTPRWGATYNQFTARLADRGFVTLAVHNPYWGGYRFLQLERKAQPLKATLGSIIAAEHLQFLRWLSTLPFVDPDRIGFYGISYGGWTANRIPPLLDQYCLAICSACFNDWIRKVTNVDDAPGSYMQNVAFNMAEWDSAHTFSNAEMAYLMIPRPFMVERGMHDPVAPDSWVAYEYAKVQWLYWQLGLPEGTRIEFFNGGHVIHGQGAFAFLHQHLDWPEPSESSAKTFTTNATTRDSGTESSM